MCGLRTENFLCQKLGKHGVQDTGGKSGVTARTQTTGPMALYVDTRSSSKVGLLNLCGKRSKREVTGGAKVFMVGPRTALTVGKVMYVTQLAVTLRTCDTLYRTRYEVVLHTPAALSRRGGGLVI